MRKIFWIVTLLVGVGVLGFLWRQREQELDNAVFTYPSTI